MFAIEWLTMTDLAYKIFVLNKVFKIKLPIFVSWAITYRCDNNCSYCGVKDVSGKDLNTLEALSIVEDMSRMGTKYISFTGGEPLLRDDIGTILKRCREKGIYVSVNTNGALVPKRADELEGINRLVLSLDGPEEVHDSLRGSGSYRQVLEAAKIAKAKSWKIKLTSVLSTVNLDYINFILNTAKDILAPVIFQPARRLKRGSAEINYVLEPGDKYDRAIKLLISHKLNNNRFLGNSLLSLKHFAKWPSFIKGIPCSSGQICCRIENNGIVKGCGDELNNTGVDAKKFGFRKAFLLFKPYRCNECWIASQVELNLMYAFNFSSIINSISLI